MSTIISSKSVTWLAFNAHKKIDIPCKMTLRVMDSDTIILKPIKFVDKIDEQIEQLKNSVKL